MKRGSPAGEGGGRGTTLARAASDEGFDVCRVGVGQLSPRRRRVGERNRAGLVHGAHAVVALERRGLGGREVENQRWYAWEVSYRECVGPLFRERIVMLSAGEVDDVFGFCARVIIEVLRGDELDAAGEG